VDLGSVYKKTCQVLEKAVISFEKEQLSATNKTKRGAGWLVRRRLTKTNFGGQDVFKENKLRKEYLNR
jgi:hypothetical protein